MTDTTTAVHSTPQHTRRPRRWPWIAGIITAAVVGLGIGSAGEPETITETVTVDPSDEREAELDARAFELDDWQADLTAQEAALEERQAELAEREQALGVAEAEAAANTVSDGVWTVGVDIEPGTYRATDVGSDCYWAVLVSGTNGSDIVDNGIPGGGNPVVTVQEGQDFESSRCGEWHKQD